jgi:hypothetical protein
MSRRSLLAIPLAVALGLVVAGTARAQHQHPKEEPAKPAEHPTVEAAVNASMGAHQHHQGPHFKLTTPRPATPADQARAEETLKTLRQTLEKYRDYRVALDDGYKIFLPDVPLPEYHFTNYWYGALAAFTFDPAKPTSLLYKKTKDGYELTGAMYTASRLADEDDLHERIPLSVAQWHAHVNICLPPAGQERTADWTRFGPRGSIWTEEECRAANGRWRPQMFGWMVHVYPFESSSEKIWPR